MAKIRADQINDEVATEEEVQKSSMVYAADGGGSDAYAITLDPAPAGYTAGMEIKFKANTANTGAATLNVNSLGAVTIKKLHDQDLADNDIEAGQIVSVVYDGTYFQMQSQTANAGAITLPGSSTDNAIVRFDDTGGNKIQNSTVTIDDNGNMTFNSDAGRMLKRQDDDSALALSGGSDWNKGAYLELGGNDATGDVANGSGQVIMEGTTSQFRFREGTSWNDAFTIVGDGTVTAKSKFGVKDSNNTYETYFQGGSQSGDITYTLPTAGPASDKYLKCTSSNVMSWADAAGTVESPRGHYSNLKVYTPYLLVDEMSANNAPSPLVASADTEYASNYAAWNAFEMYTDTYRWASSTGAFPHWLKIDLGSGNAKIVRYIQLKPYTSGYLKDFEVFGSNNDSDYTSLGTGQHGNNTSQEGFSLTNSTAYRYYKIVFSNNWDVGYTQAEVTRWVLWESAPLSTVVISADALSLYDGTTTKEFRGVRLYPSIAASGADGLDTGSEAANTWYYIWAVGKSDGTIAGLLSTSWTAPTLPSGYTFYKLLGAVYNNSSSNFREFMQTGNSVYYTEACVWNLLANGSATTWTRIDASIYLPENCGEMRLFGHFSNNHAGYINVNNRAYYVHNENVYAFTLQTKTWELSVMPNRACYYKCSESGISFYLALIGYTFNL